MSKLARALIVDDHPIVVNALIASLTSLGTCDEIDQEHSFAAALDRLHADTGYDIVVLDLNLGDTEGADTIVRFREEFPDLKVVIFSGESNREIMTTAFEKGVHGYIPKNYAMPVIVNAIRTVLAGSVFVPPEVVTSLGLSLPESVEIPAVEDTPMPRLSPRQGQVFEQVLEGIPNKVIAARLDMAEGTVKTHLNTIYRLFDVNNRAKLIIKAQRLGLA